ncbi:DUF6941 family protein [Dongia rigui]|uniref:Uncharacterized protein n=1 Tax=Dongia rigui TaxID=940149 RepID=A0ABU5E0J9_9PROT|nr:hypothetical protein [Dongia rigui]MDY0873119.1 hypothetical protein [Dongia rigui]
MKYRLGTLTICDDVRLEINGKETIVGLYNNVLVVPSVPHRMLKLCFRLPLFLAEPVSSKAKFEVFSPSGKVMLSAEGDIEVKTIEEESPAPFTIAVGNALLPEFGTYHVKFIIGPGKPKRVASFLVRQPRPGDPIVELGPVFLGAPNAAVPEPSKPAQSVKKTKTAKSSNPTRRKS